MDSPEIATVVATQDAVQKLLIVLNDVYGGHTWCHNVVQEAAEEALAEAVAPLFGVMRARLRNFGGFERRGSRVSFWVNRDDVLRLLDEVQYATQLPLESDGGDRG